MAKTKISEFSSTPANNTDIDSINIAEGCAPSGINDAIRELMAQLKDFQTGAAGDSFNGPVGTTTAAAGAFTTLTASSTATLNTLASSGATLTGGSINNMTIGGTTAAAVSATTLATSGAVTLNGGTANGVAYLNGSKVLTTGSALTFDGSEVFKNSGGTIQYNDIRGSAAAGTRMSAGGTLGTDSFDLFQNSSAGYVYNRANTPLIFGINNTEQMRLTSTGLGIGTSSPSAKLDVRGQTFVDNVTVSTSKNLSTWNVNGANYAHLYDIGTTANVLALGGSGTISGVPSSPIMAWDLDNASVGIGTSSPGTKLDVQSASNPAARIWSTGGAIGNYAELKLNAYNNFSGQSQSYIRAISTATGNSGTALAFAVEDNGFGNPAEGMRLTSTGLLIGTTSNPQNSKLMVGGGVHVKPSANNSLEIFGPNSGTGIRLFARNDAGTLNRLELQGGQVIFPLTSGTDGLHFDASSGNLGLGVTPSAWSGVKALQVQNASFVGQGYNAFVFANSYYNGTNDIYLTTGGASYYAQSNGQHIWYRAPSGTAGNAISFTQAMSLTANGDLLVGKTSANAKIDVEQTGIAWARSVTHNNAGTQYFDRFAYGGTAIGSITGNGTATAYNTSSDYRLKENIAPMTGALAKVAALKPVTYTWKADGSAGEGFIAHELAEVCPAAVTGEKDAVDAEGMPQYQGIDASFLVGTLTAAIQEQQAIINQLKARLDAAGIA